MPTKVPGMGVTPGRSGGDTLARCTDRCQLCGRALRRQHLIVGRADRRELNPRCILLDSGHTSNIAAALGMSMSAPDSAAPARGLLVSAALPSYRTASI